jgi:hypothetical protein
LLAVPWTAFNMLAIRPCPASYIFARKARPRHFHSGQEPCRGRRRALLGFV